MLKKLKGKMPSKKDELEGMDMEGMEAAEAMESPMDEAMESPEEQSLEAELGVEKDMGDSSLDSMSDDELLAEIKKRGLLGKLEEGSSEEEGDDQYI